MKTFKITCLATLLFVFSNIQQSMAQRGAHHNAVNRGNVKQNPNTHRNREVVVKHNHVKHVVVRSKYRPKTVVVYHPHWAPKYNCHRRWVYFPRYNFYWDNWRQMYVYRNNNAWIYGANKPVFVANVNLETEKHVELKEDEDDVDEVYSTNDAHKTEYKPE
jgi:hypothetical protein